MKKFLNNIAVKFERFMYGRYGFDRLYRGLLWIYFIVIILALYPPRVLQSLYLPFSVFSQRIQRKGAWKTTNGLHLKTQ